ncbi:hypothetical protein DFH29DRAFT_76963 [Suillus ampliporus]|nr:hypothetical protein DFH29DRAFT_76963 [Suillus ampliporus]
MIWSTYFRRASVPTGRHSRLRTRWPHNVIPALVHRKICDGDSLKLIVRLENKRKDGDYECDGSLTVNFMIPAFSPHPVSSAPECCIFCHPLFISYLAALVLFFWLLCIISRCSSYHGTCLSSSVDMNHISGTRWNVRLCLGTSGSNNLSLVAKLQQ